MNAQFQRIPRRDKKDLREKCKEMRKTIEWERRDLFKKIRDTKGAFHAKMGSIKDRNDMDITEAENLQKYLDTNTQYTVTKETQKLKTGKCVKLSNSTTKIFRC